MTDIRSRISGVVLNRLADYGIDMIAREIADSVAEAVMTMPGIAITQLPPLMGDRSVVAESIRDRPMWAVNDAWASISDEDEIELEADGQMLCGALKSAQDARDLAAVLLAAAVQAQEPKQPNTGGAASLGWGDWNRPDAAAVQAQEEQA